VEPIFGWLIEHGGMGWPAELLSLCDGLHLPPREVPQALGRRGRSKRPLLTFDPGPVVPDGVAFKKERKVKASPDRLAWLIRNAHRLAPINGKTWKDYRKRVLDHPKRDEALALLDAGVRKGIPRKLILEGPTYADCLIECEHAILWIEGKRHDWLSTGTKWDLCRDQIARNLEAAWHLAMQAGKECCVLLCHEHELKHHEQLLIDGYRSGTWSGGWPHLPPELRRELGRRIGTVTWSQIVNHWPALRELEELEELADLADSTTTQPASNGRRF
jgi:hypothetical protein